MLTLGCATAYAAVQCQSDTVCMRILVMLRCAAHVRMQHATPVVGCWLGCWSACGACVRVPAQCGCVC
jgi:hypothetical protein